MRDDLVKRALTMLKKIENGEVEASEEYVQELKLTLAELKTLKEENQNLKIERALRG